MRESLHFASFPANSCTPKLANTSINVRSRMETCRRNQSRVSDRQYKISPGSKITEPAIDVKPGRIRRPHVGNLIHTQPKAELSGDIKEFGRQKQ